MVYLMMRFEKKREILLFLVRREIDIVKKKKFEA